MESATYPQDIDLAQMRISIEEKAKIILNEVTEDDVNYFVKEAKNEAKHLMAKYIFTIYNFYTEGEFAIKNMDSLEAFTNPDTGFQAQMLNWIDQSDIAITQADMNYAEAPTKRNTSSFHKTTLGVGTAIAAGLLIFKHPWIALTVELLALSASYVQYKNKDNNEKRYNEQLEKYTKDITALKNSFVNSMISDMEKWLKDGQQKTKEVLNTFKLI